MSDDHEGTDGPDRADGRDAPDPTDDRADGRPRGDVPDAADADGGSPADGADGGDEVVAIDGQDVDDLLSEFEEPDGDLDDLFDEVASADVDADAVWAELEGSVPGADANASGDAEPVEDPLDDAVLGEGPGDEAIVSKASYCQQCEHFSSPPDVGCDNPGTEIVDLVDVKHFRVRDCPVVARRRGATVSTLDDGDVGDDGGAPVHGIDGTSGDAGDDGTPTGAREPVGRDGDDEGRGRPADDEDDAPDPGRDDRG